MISKGNNKKKESKIKAQMKICELFVKKKIV